MPKILVAEDDDDLRLMLRKRMERDGHRVTEARHGREALQFFKKALDEGDPFDAVTLDFLMPYVDGDRVKMAIDDYCRGAGCEPPKMYMFTGAEEITMPSRLRKAQMRTPVFKDEENRSFQKPNDVDDLMKQIMADFASRAAA